jgi:hypothetical protein
MKLLCAMLLLFSSICQPRNLCAQDRYKKTNVCHVRAANITKQAVSVEITGSVLPDMEHGTILIDPKCPGIGIYVETSRHPDPSVAAFYKALRNNASLGIPGMRVHGSFFGRLRRDRKTKTTTIVLFRVEDIIVMQRDGTPVPSSDVSP